MLELYEKLTSVTALRRQTYSHYEIRRAGGVNRYLESLSTDVGHAKTAGAVSESLNEGVDISQPTARITEEQTRLILTVDNSNLACICRGVDQGDQESDGNGKSAIEYHCVERRVKVRH